jgi:general secretion pathway protein I
MTDRPAAGFTLIEVLIALAILAVAFGFGIPAISGSLSRGTQTALQDRATTLAESLLARAGADIPLAEGGMEGQAGDLAWRVTIAPWLNEGDASQHAGATLYRVEVTVSDRRQRRLQQLVSLRLAPPP